MTQWKDGSTFSVLAFALPCNSTSRKSKTNVELDRLSQVNVTLSTSLSHAFSAFWRTGSGLNWDWDWATGQTDRRGSDLFKSR